MNTFYVILLFFTVSFHQGDACGTRNIECLSDTSFQFCIINGTEVILIDGIINCDVGTVCSETETFVCIELSETETTTETTVTSTSTVSSTSTDSTTTTVTTVDTTTSTGVPDNCTEAGKYSADACDQYWECVAVMWWYDLVLQTCDSGLSYNATSQECVANGTCDTTTTVTESTTVTTTAATEVPDNCTEAGRYLADACDQYWECVAVMWWYDLVLQTCDSGLSYNATSQECVANGTCDSTTTVTESTTVTTTATTTTAAGPPETCTEAGKYVADACNQYYECVYVMWWYDLVLQTCDADQQYDASTQLCVTNSTCIV